MATLPAHAGAYAFQLEMSLAGLTSCGGQMQGLADGLVDGLGVEFEHGTQARGHRGAEMCDMVDLVLVQADSASQIDLCLVGGGQAANQVITSDAELLRDGYQRGMLSPGCE